ncbi:MAG: bifunctional diaminohydroxyphosphoribosylaminopyrimidine deaminase/5-amino-6-(5-phosphoribosylamino)uracil reductase RibD [Paludibacteraceae bacterium]|nr:bifunctional diaminohydroxyphosphoribosylaminopyrimidine deaminase/5-amino-6-(5-phosphoribosylamino)uracil reductase RibD [Paludibacteraceae bacterium]
MTTDEKYMHHCLKLAEQGLGSTAPNPMVGATIVHNGQIIGEGYHQRYGEPHAEPNAIHSVKDQSLLPQSTLYVNLEPCSHYGKTPPCAALIIEKKIPRVVIANVDPFPKVSGRGIKMMQDAGIDVTLNVLKNEGRILNKRFFTFHEKKRPFIMLKWAQSADGFVDGLRTERTTPPVLFSTPETQKLNHKMRTEEAAILVGTTTVLMDNPQLTARLWPGKNPVRIAIDREGKITDDYKIFDGHAETLIFTEKSKENKPFVTFVCLDFSKDVLPQLLHELYLRNINSLIVEGGTKLLQSFINQDLWDEATIEIAPITLGNGIVAPEMPAKFLKKEQSFGQNKVLNYAHYELI